MDARTLLETVAETYAKLNSFEIEILFTSESGDEDASSRNSQRARAFFAAPDKVRVEQSGRRGLVIVTDGVSHDHYFRGVRRYSTNPVQAGHRLPGMFSPEYPWANGTTFLFNRIAENVTSAEVLREEADARVISVTYDPTSRPGFAVSISPVMFWIDPRTNFVSRTEGEMTHRLPDRDEQHSRNSYVYQHAFVNQTIPPRTFEYAPPADAIDESETPRRGGSWSSYKGPDEKRRFEAWHSNAWAGETFEEQFELTIREIELTLERRFTLTGKDLRISERIVGPKGPTERELSIPVAE